MAIRYREIAEDLRRRIESGEFAPGARLPGYRELVPMYRAGRDSVRRALKELEADGLIEIEKKAGIKVRLQGDRRRIRRGTGVMRDPARGYVFPAAAHPQEPWEPHGRPQASMEPVPANVAELLGVRAETKVLRRRRVMSPAGEPPFDIVDTWIHPAAVAEAPQVAEPSTGPGGYLDRLEEAGHGPISWRERGRARMPSGEEARLLRMPRSGLPVLELTRVGHSGRTGQPVEVTVAVIPADRVETWTDLPRDESAHWPIRPVEPGA